MDLIKELVSWRKRYMDNFDVKYKMINGVPVPVIRPMMKPVVNHVEKKLSDIPKVEKIRRKGKK